ncbi:probable transcription factor At4g00390 [Herrania umbratica]|uniref:Probable transcription factor At4g00390 n=1 Tax=Herrania umbratica TaxID=108875 RepID=A0A6J1BJY1_9ROSI|nr:probable transcription factor At4g00390 [Herrania umbratica]
MATSTIHANCSSDSNQVKSPKRNASAAVETCGEDEKKPLFQRVFNEDDEVAVLEAILEYSIKKGTNPSADINGFYDFVMKSIHVDVTKAQLKDKIKRLKKKFRKNAKGNRTFLNSHAQKIFDLSNTIWGQEVKGKEAMEVDMGESRATLEHKWRKLEIAELEVFLQRKKLIVEQAKLMLERLKSEQK